MEKRAEIKEIEKRQTGKKKRAETKETEKRQTEKKIFSKKQNKRK